MIKLPQLKYAAVVTLLALQAGHSYGDIPQRASASPRIAASDIRSSLNNKCLDVLGFNNSNGANVAMWDCNGGANQQWYWSGESIRSSMNNKCLDILGFDSSNGARVAMWDCNGGANQRWYKVGDSIKSRLNNKCLDVLGLNSSNGARVAMWDCNGGANQQWRL